MAYLPLILFTICFAAFSHLNYRLAWGFFILTLPAYLLRFGLGPMPTTLLEINLLILILVWLIKYARQDYTVIKDWIKNHRLVAGLIFLFLLSATISVAVGNETYKDVTAAWLRGAGIWKAYFVEPILMFFILLGRLRNTDDHNHLAPKFILGALVVSSLSISALAIIQLFLPGLSDPSLWDDDFSGRVTSFFTSPNAIGLYIAPLIALALALFLKANQIKEKILWGAILVLNLIAILASFSQGAWVALGVGLFMFVVMLKKYRLGVVLIVIAVLSILVSPRLQSAVTFQDAAGQNRLALWSYTTQFLTSSPQNFILGTGVRKYFHLVQKPHYNPAELERLGYPHNIFFNFWTEIGLLGALSFVGILILAIKHALYLKKSDPYLSAGLLGALVIIVVHGLVDVPYFKNDLSIIFWLILASVFWLSRDIPRKIKTPAK